MADLPDRKPCGTDRIARAAGDRIVLACRLPKGWVPRQGGRGTHAPFPGTCIRWGEELFEVLEAGPHGEGIRYVLAPWDESNAIRTIEDYDEASERSRAEARREVALRRSARWTAWAMALVVGNLPAAAQERIENELGLRAFWLTIVAALPFFAAGTTSLVLFVASMAGAPLGVPLPWLLLGLYLFVESGVRLAVAVIQAKPMGTIFVALPVVLWTAVVPRKAPALGPPEIDAARARADAFRLREPLLALLSPAEQTELASRFGFEPLRWGKRTAAVILAISLAGAVSSAMKDPRPTSLLSLVCASALAIEQMLRLARLASGRPAGSVLGAIVRPLARTLFRQP